MLSLIFRSKWVRNYISARDSFSMSVNRTKINLKQSHNPAQSICFNLWFWLNSQTNFFSLSLIPRFLSFFKYMVISIPLSLSSASIQFKINTPISIISSSRAPIWKLWQSSIKKKNNIYIIAYLFLQEKMKRMLKSPQMRKYPFSKRILKS